LDELPGVGDRVHPWRAAAAGAARRRPDRARRFEPTVRDRVPRGTGAAAVNDAAEIKVWVELRLGEILTETVKHGGHNKKAESGHTTLPKDISRDQSSTWQRLASVGEREVGRRRSGRARMVR